MKKKVAVFLLIFMALFAFAGCGEDSRVRALSVAPDDVALLSIVSDNGKCESSWWLRNYGHAFLAVKNVSDQPFVVGDQSVAPDETITIGLWSIVEHFGVWYNVESNYINECNKYAGRVSLTIGIGLDDIEKITNIIQNNDAWTVTYNCSKFALECWNSVAEEAEKLASKAFVSPSHLVEEISKFAEHEQLQPLTTQSAIRYFGEV